MPVQELIASHQTSKLFTPFISQIRKTNANARRSIKKRIELSKSNQNENKVENSEASNSGIQSLNLFDLNEPDLQINVP